MTTSAFEPAPGPAPALEPAFASEICYELDAEVVAALIDAKLSVDEAWEAENARHQVAEDCASLALALGLGDEEQLTHERPSGLDEEHLPRLFSGPSLQPITAKQKRRGALGASGQCQTRRDQEPRC